MDALALITKAARLDELTPAAIEAIQLVRDRLGNMPPPLFTPISSAGDIAGFCRDLEYVSDRKEVALSDRLIQPVTATRGEVLDLYIHELGHRAMSHLPDEPVHGYVFVAVNYLLRLRIGIVESDIKLYDIQDIPQSRRPDAIAFMYSCFDLAETGSTDIYALAMSVAQRRDQWVAREKAMQVAAVKMREEFVEARASSKLYFRTLAGLVAVIFACAFFYSIFK
ncbi:MAG: hypothetical protein ACYCRF_01900 [Acidithiobacillus sp.]